MSDISGATQILYIVPEIDDIAHILFVYQLHKKDESLDEWPIGIHTVNNIFHVWSETKYYIQHSPRTENCIQMYSLLQI